LADVAEVVVYRGLLASVAKRYIVFEAYPVDTNDTITIGELTVLTGVTGATLYRLDTGALVTCTTTGTSNVITVTNAGLVDVPVVGIASGN